ncbi:FxLYD domain-containing protein [bacterium 210820-DFI.6.37]|nr:FxLYD domain-containing protein [bacterium 210820-DFI.6.37]
MKKIIAIILVTTCIISLVACGRGSSTDDKFLTDMAAGLEARWDLSAADEESKATDNREHFEAYIDAELNKISQYKDAEFEDKDFGEKAKTYIGYIEKSKELMKYYDSNIIRFWEEYDPIYRERAKLIVEIDETYELPISDEHKKNMEELKGVADLATKIQNIIDNAKFKKVDSQYGYKTYEAVIENTTGENFDYFLLNVNLEDKDGVVVETQTPYTENWKPGVKHKFKFETEASFKKINVVSAEY